MEFFKKKSNTEKTMLEIIRNSKKAKTIATAISLASIAENALAGNEDKKDESRLEPMPIYKPAPIRESKENTISITGTKEGKGWKMVKEEEPTAFDLIRNGPTPPHAWVKSGPLEKTEKDISNSEKKDQKNLGGSNTMSWREDARGGDHHIQRFFGKHSKSCPPSENKGAGADSKFGYKNYGSGYNNGANEAGKIREKAKKMGLSTLDYLLWLSYKRSHDPTTRAKAKTLEIKGGKVLAGQKTPEKGEDFSQSLVKK